MSRIPRHQEHLKTAFTAEAVSAARLRAYAAGAARDGLPNLARRLAELAEAKDVLAIAQLEAAGQVRGAARDLASALAEESYENEVLYPKMAEELEEDEARIFAETVAAQRDHHARLVELRDAFNASRGDIGG